MGHSRKFLLCIPVRLGTFVLSLLQTLNQTIIAVAVWFALIQHRDGFSQTRQIISVILLGIAMSILAIYSLFGFIGTLLAQRRFVAAYVRSLRWTLGVSVVVGIFAIINVFLDSKAESTKECINGSTDQNVIDSCGRVNEARFIFTGLIVAVWLVHLYHAVIAARYEKQLAEEDENYSLRMLKLQESYEYEYAGLTSEETLAGPRAGHAYADSPNPFGGSSGLTSLGYAKVSPV